LYAEEIRGKYDHEGRNTPILSYEYDRNTTILRKFFAGDFPRFKASHKKRLNPSDIFDIQKQIKREKIDETNLTRTIFIAQSFYFYIFFF
jgi:hypothetical protein